VTGHGDRVTAIVAVRNCERYVAEAIDSILGQTVPPGEVVIVDDGSTDGTPDIIRSYGPPVRVVRQEARGQFSATNRAADTATGDLLAFLDADDVWTPDSLELRLARLEDDDQPEAVFGMLEQFVDVGTDRQFKFDPAPTPVTMFQTMLIRRAAYERVGPLLEDFETSANVEWMSRLRAVGVRYVEIPHVVGRRRLHGDNVSLTRIDEKRTDLLRAVRTHHRRRRDNP